MIPYYFDEAMLHLPNVERFLDNSRHLLHIQTKNGAEFEFVISRGPLLPDKSLRDTVKYDLDEHQRSLRGFELLSTTDKSYADLHGIEIRLRFIDKPGPTFRHEFHAALGSTRLGFFGIATMIHAEACDAWMAEAMSHLTLRT